MRAIFSRIGSRISCDANALSASLICAALIGRRVFVCWAAIVFAFAVFKKRAGRVEDTQDAVEVPLAFISAPLPEAVFQPPRGVLLNAPPDVSPLIDAMRRVLVGNSHVLEGLAVALLSDGHALLEGAPGLAKTLACRTMAAACGGTFARVQCNPDLTPAEVTGSEVFDPRDLAFHVRPGPIFANVVLADEINRAPARAQAAFLEAMEERQVTIGAATQRLPQPFLLLATMNEAESDGTYALPRAQLDRFLSKILADFPERAGELAMLEQASHPPRRTAPVAGAATILRWQAAVRAIYCAPRLKNYIVALVGATREAAGNGTLEYGAGPRASLALLQAARARAVLMARSFVIPSDIDASVSDVLRHRVAFSREYLLGRSERERCLNELLGQVRFE